MRTNSGTDFGARFWKKASPSGAVDEALEGHRAIPDADERAIGHSEVVLHQLELGDARIGEVQLRRVADLHVEPVEGEELGIGTRHASSLARGA